MNPTIYSLLIRLHLTYLSGHDWFCFKKLLITPLSTWWVWSLTESHIDFYFKLKFTKQYNIQCKIILYTSVYTVGCRWRRVEKTHFLTERRLAWGFLAVEFHVLIASHCIVQCAHFACVNSWQISVLGGISRTSITF